MPYKAFLTQDDPLNNALMKKSPFETAGTEPEISYTEQTFAKNKKWPVPIPNQVRIKKMTKINFHSGIGIPGLLEN